MAKRKNAVQIDNYNQSMLHYYMIRYEGACLTIFSKYIEIVEYITIVQ